VPAPATDRQLNWTVAEFIAAIAGGLVAAAVFGLAAGAVGRTESLFVALVLGQYTGHLLTIWLLLRRRRATFADLGLVVEGADVRFILLGVALQIGLAFLFAPLVQLFGPDQPTQIVSEEIKELTSETGRLVMAGSVALLAPVSEELLFEGMLLRTLVMKRGRRLGLFLTSLVFALFHLAGTTGDLLTAAIIMLPLLTVVGLVLGALAMRWSRLGPSVFVHAGFNLLALASLLIPNELLAP
jgi:membrane protease YdiL (CAAX protease family)